MDALMMVDKKLEMDAIEAKIKEEFTVRRWGVNFSEWGWG